MLNEYLKKQNDATLWHLLADISSVMSNRHYEGHGSSIMNADNFWIAAAGEIKEELDRRLFADYGNNEDIPDDDFDDLEDDEED